VAAIVSLGHQVVDWIEHYLVHGPGDVQGQPVVMDDERYGAVLRMYRLRARPRCEDCRAVAPPQALADEEAPWRCTKCRAFLPVRRAVDEYLLSRPKGWSKSGLASQVGACEALGEVRFDGWDSAGRPVARPVRYPFVRCLATEEGQSGHTYLGMAYVLHPETCSPVLARDYPRIDAGRDWQTSTRTYLPGGGEVRPSTASNAAKDGGKETHVVADEPHLWYLPELQRMYGTVHRNLFKRRGGEGWMHLTSTMFRPGQGSIMEQIVGATAAPTDRTAVTVTGRVVVDHRMAAKPLAEARDLDELVALLGEAMGDAAAFHDLERTAESIMDGRYEDSERYAGNRPQSHADDWCDVKRWDVRSILADEAAAPVEHSDGVTRGPLPPKGLRITLGFDGSTGTADNRIPDSTVLRGKVLEAGDWHGYLFTAGCWEAAGDSDWVPPFTDIDATVDWAFGQWDVWRLYGDPPGWREWLAAWKARHGDDRVIEWETYRDRQMAAALEALHDGIHAPASKLSHDGDPRVRAHYANARRNVKKARVERDDPDGKKELVLVRKETPRSALKIDGVVSDALATEAFNDGVASGAHVVKRRSRRLRSYGGRR
jgi:hypothetical protein